MKFLKRANYLVQQLSWFVCYYEKAYLASKKFIFCETFSKQRIWWNFLKGQIISCYGSFSNLALGDIIILGVINALGTININYGNISLGFIIALGVIKVLGSIERVCSINVLGGNNIQGDKNTKIKIFFSKTLGGIIYKFILALRVILLPSGCYYHPGHYYRWKTMVYIILDVINTQKVLITPRSRLFLIKLS